MLIHAPKRIQAMALQPRETASEALSLSASQVPTHSSIYLALSSGPEHYSGRLRGDPFQGRRVVSASGRKAPSTTGIQSALVLWRHAHRTVHAV